MSFNRPVTILSFPFSFNSICTDTGSAYYVINNTTPPSPTNRTFTIATTADATGTLKLDSATFNNVLRVKTIINSIDLIDMMGSIETVVSTISKYDWYNGTIKVPVLSYYYLHSNWSGPYPAIINSMSNSISTDSFIVPLTITEQLSDINKVYPNPVINEVNISGYKHDKSCIIIDMFGKTLISSTIGGGCSVDVSMLSNGVYNLVTDRNRRFIIAK